MNTEYELKIKEFEQKIELTTERIRNRSLNPHYFESTPITGMHDNGASQYENDLGMIRYYEVEISRLREEAEKEAEKEKKIALKAKKAGMTVEAYKAKKEKEKAEKALKAKIKRYHEELAELNERKAYLEKWLAENEAE